MARVVGSVFLIAQLVWVLLAQTGPSRYFDWAPNDYVTDYEISVSVDGRSLPADEVFARYRWPAKGRFENVPQHLFDIVSQYEQTYGRADRAHVLLVYTLNGRQTGQWQWPPD